MNERDEHAELVAVSVRLIGDADAPDQVRANARAWFDAQGLGAEHAEAFANISPKRLLLYRKLVRNGIRSTLGKLIPRTVARLGSTFDPWVERYCNEEMPRSHALRDVAHEFMQWVVPYWKADATIPRYVIDLLRLEVFEFQIATAAPEQREVHSVELALDKSVVFDASVRIERFAYAVQRLANEEDNHEEPIEEPTILLGYRDASFDVQMLELNALAGGILERLWAGASLGPAVTNAYGGVPPASVLESIAQLIADLAEKKVILGVV